jgi:sialic acid synthase SpsE
MSKNSIINFKDIIFKKPAIGIHAKYYKKIIGKKLKKNVILNQPLKNKDVF